MRIITNNRVYKNTDAVLKSAFLIIFQHDIVTHDVMEAVILQTAHIDGVRKNNLISFVESTCQISGIGSVIGGKKDIEGFQGMTVS